MADIHRRRFLRSTTVLLPLLAGCIDNPFDPPTYNFTEGFEDDLANWEKGSDVPQDPNNPGNPVAWDINRSTELAAAGEASLRYDLDGRQDDGTIWVARKLKIEPDQAYEVSVRAEAWSASESFNTIAHLVMYAGVNRPRDEGSFPPPGENSSGTVVTRIGGLREPLNQAEGWRPYSFTWRTPTLDTDSIVVAVGISAVWETEMTYFVDEVNATAIPR